MSYTKKIYVKLFDYFRHRLSNTQKIIYLILAIFLAALLIIKVAQLIVENQDVAGVVLGVTIFSFYIYFKRQRDIKINPKLDDVKYRKNSTIKNDINTGGGNYNGSIQGDYIQGDYINVQNNRVDISKDITSILDDFQIILTKMQTQGYSTEQAVTQMAKELAKEARKKPYLKSKFDIDKNANESEVSEKFIDFLICSNNTVLNQKESVYKNYSDDEELENYGEEINYKGYTIYLESDKDNNWHYKIYGIRYNETGENSLKYLAIDEAKGKIDEERFGNW